MDEAGNAYVYFATHDMDLSVGQVVSLRGTVKKHEMYSPKGLRPEFNPSLSYAQTQLSRCALITRAKVVKVEAEQEWYGKMSGPTNFHTRRNSPRASHGKVPRLPPRGI